MKENKVKRSALFYPQRMYSPETVSLDSSLTEEGVSLFLIWREDRGVSRDWLEGWLRWYSNSFGGVVGMCTTLL